MSNGIQFVIDEDTKIVKWGKMHMPRLNGLWNFYGGKSGIGRFVQTAFLFYGGITTAFLAYFCAPLQRLRWYPGTVTGRKSGFIRIQSNSRGHHPLLGISDPGSGHYWLPPR